MSNKDKHIDDWFYDRGITENGTAIGQATKTLEEVAELFDALNRNHTEDIMDAIGDIYVTLRGVCVTADIDMDECINQAYNEIKDRKGYLNDVGTFIKEK